MCQDAITNSLSKDPFNLYIIFLLADASWGVLGCSNSSDNQSWGDKAQLLLLVSDQEFDFITGEE